MKLTGKTAKAEFKFVRISSRKVKIVLDLIRGKKVGEAYSILEYIPKVGTEIAEKLLKSTVDIAKKVKKMDESKLVIVSAYANNGPTLKRFIPKAMGKPAEIKKRMSHITMIVGELEEKPRAEKVIKKAGEKAEKVAPKLKKVEPKAKEKIKNGWRKLKLWGKK